MGSNTIFDVCSKNGKSSVVFRHPDSDSGATEENGNIVCIEKPFPPVLKHLKNFKNPDRHLYNNAIDSVTLYDCWAHHVFLTAEG